MSESQETWQPGHQLRTLREEANISLDSIAKETLIPFNKLQLLEADQYDKIGKPVFVIAYIRKYAKSLGINSDAFVEQLKIHTGMASGDGSTQADKDRKSGSFQLPKVPALVIIPALVAVWLLSVWILKDDEVDEPAVVQPESSEPPVSAAPVASTPAVNIPAEVERQTAQNLAGTQDEALEAEQEVLEEAPVVEDIAASGERREGEEGDILVLNFFEACWVEVKDANDEVIFAQLQNSGDNLRLSGEAPFNVMLGNARAVDLVVNGRRVSTEPPPGRRTLKIDVGP